MIPGVQGLDPRRRTPNTPPFARAQRFNPGGDSSHAPTTLKNRILIPGGMDLTVTWNTQIPFSFPTRFSMFYTTQQISACSIDNRTNHVSPTSSAGLASPTEASRLARLNSDYLSHTTDTTNFYTCFKLDINSDQHGTPTHGITHTYVSYPSSTLHPPPLLHFCIFLFHHS